MKEIIVHRARGPKGREQTNHVGPGKQGTKSGSYFKYEEAPTGV